MTSEEAFKRDISDWEPASDLKEGEQVTWEVQEDGSMLVRIPSVIAYNLADDLARWDVISLEQHKMPEGWKKSSILRENRRESVVYGNCFMTIWSALGRRFVSALMSRYAAIPPVEGETKWDYKKARAEVMSPKPKE